MLNPPLLFLWIVLYVLFSFFIISGNNRVPLPILLREGVYMGMFRYLTAFEEMINQVKQVV